MAPDELIKALEDVLDLAYTRSVYLHRDIAKINMENLRYIQNKITNHRAGNSLMDVKECIRWIILLSEFNGAMKKYMK